ncbi:MAG: hypothetical protein NC489_38615 [Ruminococcus flavefaciens]|nr:hypothetical protein [Ruminococcus flavefaciens]
MKAYKAFNKDLTCTRGRGVFRYKENRTHKEPEANCARNGFHCAENPLDCLTYYPDWDDSIYYLVEAGGDIDEDDKDTKISCTELTLLSRLHLSDFICHAVSYMANHPKRAVTYRSHGLIRVCREEYASKEPVKAVIVRGKEPRAAAPEGCIVALVQEEQESKTVKKVKVYLVDGKLIKAGTAYSLREKVTC